MAIRTDPTLVDWLVYAAVRLAACVFQAMPVETARRLGRRIGDLAYLVDRRHRRVAVENLLASFPGSMAPARATRLTRRVYRHFGIMLAEMVHLPRLVRITTWRRYVTLKGHRELLRTLLRDEPQILVTGHFGNWEVIGYVLGVYGFVINSVARPIDNPLLEGLLRRLRERTGQKLITKKGALPDLDAVLAARGSLAFLADQSAGRRGEFVEFFGRPASTFKTIALLALARHVPIRVGVARRTGNRLHYEIVTVDSIRPEEFTGGADDVHWITQRYTKALEDLVRADPDQYFWLHRRWKGQPRRKADASSKSDAHVSGTGQDRAADDNMN